jgi:hypothetical protein
MRAGDHYRNITGRQRAQRVIKFIQTLTVPSGAGQGKRFKLMDWQKAFIRDIYEPHKNGRRVVRRAILSISRKNGKLLALDTPIPTPRGFVRNGDLKIGDYVFDEHGNTCRVTFISPVTLGERCFRLSFADGSSIVAGASHQWLTTHKFRPWAPITRGLWNLTSGQNRKPVTDVVTTGQIAATLHIERNDGGREHNHKVPIAGALQISEANLLIAPYVLGYWLGNGNSNSAQVTSGSIDADEIHCYLEQALGFATHLRVNAREDGSSNALHGLAHSDCRGLVINALRTLGVANNKHIPEVYKWASHNQRLALLQGLMDSDGSASGNPKAPQCYFDNTNEQLARDVLFLVRSLGFKAAIREDRATLHGRDMGACWSVIFSASQEDEVFRLERKRAMLLRRVEDGKQKRSRSNAIVACDEVLSVATQCVQVDSPSHLYLAGEGLTPTHNTSLIAGIALAHLIGPEATVHGEI